MCDLYICTDVYWQNQTLQSIIATTSLKMKLSVAFALLSLATVVMGMWQDVSGVCKSGEGYAVQRVEKGGGKFCTREFFFFFLI